VEFALVAVPFITLVFGAIDFGYAVNNDVMINNAAREGAREGSLNPDAAAVTAVVVDSLNSTPGTPSVSVTCKKSGGGACALASATSGDVVVVTVTLHHDWITPLGDTFSSGGIDLTKTSEMRIE
jgi:Flp pilus assembly protein TadG